MSIISNGCALWPTVGRNNKQKVMSARVTGGPIQKYTDKKHGPNT